MKRPLDLNALRPETRAILAGRDPARSEGAVNPPIHRASTLILDHVEDLYGGPKPTYALHNMAVHEALCEALIAIEGGAGASLAPSGLAACTLAIMAMAREGGELLVVDSVYGPTRRFCDRMLKRLGVRTIYYPPRIGADIAHLITERTCGVVLESPGSLTLEIQDAPAIVAAAKARGVPTMIDNTWSAGVLFKPFAHGVDLSVQALTKYQGGHADLLLGAVLSASPAWAERVAAARRDLGLFASPDDCFLALRGLRTMHLRLERQGVNALALAQWLEARPEIARVRHPALPSSPDHALWRRDFSGAAGVFAFELKPVDAARVNAMLENLAIFAMGFSWGGYESLILPCDPQIMRTAEPWRGQGPLIRVSAGLEHPDDLIADLAHGFTHMGGGAS